MATDTAVSPKSREGSVYVRFLRDRHPRFDNLPRTQQVSENAENNSLVYTVRGRDDDKVVSFYYCALLLFDITEYVVASTNCDDLIFCGRVTWFTP